jgi:hypothetical protein
MPADSHRPSQAPRVPASTETELVVEPTLVGGRRRSKVPGAIAAACLSLFVVLAVWKPWEGPTVGPRPSARASSGDLAAGPVEPGPTGRVLPVDTSTFPSNARLLAAATSQPAWGVRAVVLRTGGPIFTGQTNVVERWVKLPADVADGSPAPPAIAIAQPDDDVAAIGITSPDDALPLDIRVWSLPPAGPPQRVSAFAIAGPEAGSWLWLADRAHATDHGTWPAGAYEIEVLLGPRIVRVLMTIPSASPTSSHVQTPLSQPPFASILETYAPGLFALADGGAQPLGNGSSPPVDEREAWLGPAAGLPPVGVVTGGAVTGFGRLFAAGDEPLRVDLVQLAPRSSPIETDINIVAVEPGHRQAIVAFPASGGFLPDGLYHMMVRWNSAGANRSAESAIEVQPQVSATLPNAPLDAMARWFGLLDRRDVAAREPLIFVGDPAAPDSCGARTVIMASDRLFGIVVPQRDSVVGVRLHAVGETAADVPIRFAPEAVPRLTVVALPLAGLPVGAYDLVVTHPSDAGEQPTTQRICVGNS